MSDEELADEYVRNHVHYKVGIREDGTEYIREISSVTIKQAFFEGLKAGKDMNFATKWYYPSKGEYPRKEALYLCQWQDGEITADEIYIDGNGEPYFAGSVTFADIFAWKEIVLPEEKVEDEKEAK